jgi:alpha-tubulin suppressor-like RCC1 family protein
VRFLFAIVLAGCTPLDPNFADGGGLDASADGGMEVRDAGRQHDAGTDGGVPLCPAGAIECDGDPSDPCDGYPWANEDGCGDCTTMCPADELCVAGDCRTPVLASAALGSLYTCVLTTTGNILCWGANRVGQLGDGRFDPIEARLDRADAVAVLDVDDATQIDATDETTCALRDGLAYCWGHNIPNRFGDPDDRICSVCSRPIRLLGTADPIEEIEVGGVHICVRTADDVLCSGSNGSGALGGLPKGTRSPLLLALPGLPELETPIALGAGGVGSGGYTCVVMSNGRVYCTGTNSSGECGQPTDRFTLFGFEEVPALADIVDVFTSRDFACALDDIGDLYCWGDNTSGQLGRGTIGDDFPTPERVDLPFAVGAVALGSDWVIAVSESEDEVYVWGDARDGRLGLGSGAVNTGTPTRARGTTGFRYIPFAGAQHSCLIEIAPGEDPELLCAGDNSHYQLGTTEGARSSTFEPVEALEP